MGRVEIPILLGVVMLAATTFLTARLLYGGLQSVELHDARDSQLLFTIAEEPATERSLEIRAPQDVFMGKMYALNTLERRLEDEALRHMATARRVADTTIDADIVQALGLVTDRLDARCHALQLPDGRDLGLVRHNMKLLSGGALITWTSPEAIPSLLLAFAIGIATLSSESLTPW